MKKPVIGITGNQRPFREEEGMYLSYTPTGFVQGVQEAGGNPFDPSDWRPCIGWALYFLD